MSTPSIALRVSAADARERRGEPVTCGIPWPRGVLRDPAPLALHSPAGVVVPLQTRVLDRWPDGSVRWLLLDWLADVRGEAVYRLVAGAEPAPTPERLVLTAGRGSLRIATGATTFQILEGLPFPFQSVVQHGVTALATSFRIEEASGKRWECFVERCTVEEAGPIRACVHVEGVFARGWRRHPLQLFARLHFFTGSPVVRFEVTLRNPRRAAHPGGQWDLGDPGSLYLREAVLRVAFPDLSAPCSLQCSPEVDAPLDRHAMPLEIYQDSSGGANWDSTNHVNRHHVVPNTFRGYRLRAEGQERRGLRATPLVVLERGDDVLAVTMPYFWQNFPKAVEATADDLVLSLFPRQYADVHEIQGGEQKTHRFFLAFGRDPVTEVPLAWARSPARAAAAPDWYCSTGAIPFLTPRADDRNTDYLRLVDAAIEGDDTFTHKREVVDEYGWRHFGDIYGDHEAVRHAGPKPLVSHYNNQYDPLAGFAYQFLRSGDGRWWTQMEELAAHVRDIDVYHTDQDKSAYNHGLFWHTYHYVDADTATHRSYPRAAKLCGGGPGGEQNYTTGLMLHYFLTGDALSRETALELARWVITMDDGNRTVFRWLARGPTGLASSTASPLYHGPGRGAGNSVNALVDGYRLTGDPAFLAKAEELIRRCVHPEDDIAARNLHDAERRWSYTVFFQALAKYLHDKAERGELDLLYAYARASLLHYARWMADHEYPLLTRPEILQYPTETWAAQDMRKSEVFKYAALHADGEERSRFLERSDFFFRYVTQTLQTMKTRTLARPVILLLSYGFLHAYLQQHPDARAPLPAVSPDAFPPPVPFVPQKVIARRRFLLVAALGGLVGLAGLGALLAWLV